jgi:hypothetical protein
MKTDVLESRWLTEPILRKHESHSLTSICNPLSVYKVLKVEEIRGSPPPTPNSLQEPISCATLLWLIVSPCPREVGTILEVYLRLGVTWHTSLDIFFPHLESIHAQKLKPEL